MFEIAGRPIGADQRPFVVAEMSGNHDGSLDRALAIVDAVADAGADALKLQTYTADTMTIDVRGDDFMVHHTGNPWTGSNLYELYEQAHTPWGWHQPIFERANEHGLIAFSAPFDATAVDFLETLDVPCYKIASFENVDHALIEKAASTGKPLIISTGLATLSEIEGAVQAAHRGGCEQLALLKCTSAYPASPEDSNLRTIPHLREAFGCEVGLSDHTLGIGVPLASIAFRASIIEKHVTLDRSSDGVDSAFSLEPDQLRQLIDELEHAWQALGKIRYGPSATEEASMIFRRSLYAVDDIPAGSRLTEANVRAIRPGFGITPSMKSYIMGRRAAQDIARGTPVSWEHID